MRHGETHSAVLLSMPLVAFYAAPLSDPNGNTMIHMDSAIA